MKVWKIIVVPLVVLVLAITTSCGSNGNQTVRQYQQVQVSTGELTTRVSGSGKVTVVTDAKLAFGVGGKLALLNVSEGDKVTKGEVLARLDTTDLEQTVRAAELSVKLSQTDNSSAQENIAAAGIALEQAQDNLNKITYPYTYHAVYVDVPTALGYINNANVEINNAITALNAGQTSAEALAQLQHALDNLNQSYDQLHRQGYDLDIFADQFLNINLFWTVRSAEFQVEAAQTAVDLAQNAATKTSLAIDVAKNNLTGARNQLDKAVITAPFDGVVATVSADVGDIIPSPAVSAITIIYLVDTSEWETDVNIGEMDAPSVQAGQKAAITLDALPDVTINGTVKSISLVPSAQAAASGSTVYVAKVNFTAPSELGVKTGMNTNVDIITGDVKNVLLLPNEAIKKDGNGGSYVQILNNQQVVSKPVVTGLSNATQTEISSGLQQGDKVITSQPPGEWSQAK